MRAPWRAGLAALGLVVASACGTTVPVAEQKAIVGGGIDAPPVEGGTGTGPVNDSGTATTPPVTEGTVAPADGPTASANGTVTSAPAATTAPGASTSADRTPIHVGFLTNSCSQCKSYFGGGSIGGNAAHSEQTTTQSLIDYLNKRGGIAGRKVVPHFHEFDVSKSFTAQYQAACADFTDDHHVSAVLGYASTWSELLATCLAKHHTLWIDAGNELGDLTQMQRYPNLFATNSVSYDGIVLSGLESALHDGWLTKTSRIGVLRGGCNYQQNAYKNTALPFLQHNGLKVVAESVYSSCFNGSDVSSFAAFIEGAELKMRSMGVDVVFSPPVESLVYSLNADTQGYYPKYVSYGAGGAAGEGIFSDKQARNWHSAGWLPGLDVNSTHQPPVNAAQQQCLSMAKSSGIVVAPKERYNFYADCDALLVFQRAVTATGGSTALATVSAAIESFGSTFRSASMLTSASRVSAGRHEFATVYRANTYSPACACFLYSGPVRTITGQ